MRLIKTPLQSSQRSDHTVRASKKRGTTLLYLTVASKILLTAVV